MNTTWAVLGDEVDLSQSADEPVKPDADPDASATDVNDEDHIGLNTPEKVLFQSIMTRVLVNTCRLVRKMIDEIKSLRCQTLFIDAEGIDLSKTGDVITLQVFIESENGPVAYIMDVWALKKQALQAFNICGRRWRSTTLQSILEDPNVPKLLWDCRMDSEALFWQFGVSLTSVIDIQLMEVIRRPGHRSKDFLGGYARAVKEDIEVDPWEAQEMVWLKRKVQALFIPDKGGSWNVLKRRPLSDKIIEYCVGDIMYMPLLYRMYAADIAELDYTDAPRDGESTERVSRQERRQTVEPAAFLGQIKGERAKEVLRESTKRIQRSQKEGWNRKRDNMTRSPWWVYRDPYDDNDKYY